MAPHISQSSNFGEMLYDCQEIIGLAPVLIAFRDPELYSSWSLN